MIRLYFAAALAALALGVQSMAPPAKPDAWRQAGARAPKPGARPGAETCRWAHDNECDEPVIGTGACAAHTDYSDCRYLRYGESDACAYARDGECDEPGFGTGACPMGSDRTDCGDVAALRFRDDSCVSAFNGVCDEPVGGNGTCARRTDRADCVGRERPMSLSDHFFGHDDRVLIGENQFPWSVIGRLTLTGGRTCTATLVAPDVLVTAAHCIFGDNGVDARAEFVTARGMPGGPRRAAVTDYLISRTFNLRRFEQGSTADGHDWAFLRIDRRLGDELGFVRVEARFGPTPSQSANAIAFDQAGYAWDTGDRLSGHLGCHLAEAFADNTFAHECDTTRGDSGSPLLMRDGEGYVLAGVDSRFRSNRGGAFAYVAVNAAAFEPYLADFASGRTAGGRIGGARKP